MFLLLTPTPLSQSFSWLHRLDSDDQTGAFQRPGIASAELGTLPAQLPPQEPVQAQGAQEEEHEEGVHTIPTSAAREQGQGELA